MKITNVRIHPATKNMERLKAYASVTFDGALTINEVMIILADRGLCIEFPKDPRSVELHSETVVPRNHKTRKYIEAMVLNAYNNQGKEDECGNFTNIRQNHSDRCSA